MGAGVCEQLCMRGQAWVQTCVCNRACGLPTGKLYKPIILQKMPDGSTPQQQALVVPINSQSSTLPPYCGSPKVIHKQVCYTLYSTYYDIATEQSILRDFCLTRNSKLSVTLG